MNNIIGRKREIHRLNNCLEQSEAQLIMVYGRRRVGKTFLINQYFNNSFDFKFTGAFGQKREVQLKNFINELNRQSKQSLSTPNDWTEAFKILRTYIKSLPINQKQVIFFDEMPWMDTFKSNFLKSFEWFWNNWGCSRKNLVFIVCGSSTSWLQEKILSNKGGLFNRLTCKIYLNPFNLYETELFLQNKNINWSRYDIAQCYMILGGIPYYLNFLDREMSFNDNIDYLFFKKRAELWDEFDNLYHTLFSNSEVYIKVIEALSTKKVGMTREEIIATTKLPGNGNLTTILNNLIDSGFVRLNKFYNHKKKETLYQLSDYYTLFYYKFIKNNYGKDEHFWANNLANPSRRAWIGFTFEQLCKDHTEQIKKKLGISGVLCEESTWIYKGEEGAQIDLIFDRRDRVINIFEIKFSVNEYEIDKSYDKVLKNKISIFAKETNNRKTLLLTMITTYGVKQNMYSNFISNQVLLDDLFVDV